MEWTTIRYSNYPSSAKNLTDINRALAEPKKIQSAFGDLKCFGIVIGSNPLIIIVRGYDFTT